MTMITQTTTAGDVGEHVPSCQTVLVRHRFLHDDDANHDDDAMTQNEAQNQHTRELISGLDNAS